MYIPEKYEVAYNKRNDTLTKKLGFTVPYTFNKSNELELSERNLKKIMRWSLYDDNFKSNEKRRESFENKPQEGFICNSLVGGVGSGWGDYDREEKIRIYHPDGFEFEIKIWQFFNILSLKGCQPGGVLNGEYVLYWNNNTGLDSVNLISIDDPEYKKYYEQLENSKNTEQLENDGDDEDLIVGGVYLIDNTNYVYLGEHSYYKGNIGIKKPVIKVHTDKLFVKEYKLNNYYDDRNNDITNILNDIQSLVKYAIIAKNEKYERKNIIEKEKIDNILKCLYEDNIFGVTLEKIDQSIKDKKPILHFINNVIGDNCYGISHCIWKYTGMKKTTINFETINDSVKYNTNEYKLCTLNWRLKYLTVQEPNKDNKAYLKSLSDKNFKNEIIKNKYYSFRHFYCSDILKNKPFDSKYYGSKYYELYFDYNSYGINNTFFNLEDITLNKLNLDFIIGDKMINEWSHSILDRLKIVLNIKCKDKTFSIYNVQDLNNAISYYTDLPVCVYSLNYKIGEKYSGKQQEYIVNTINNNKTTYTYARKEYDVPQEYFDYLDLLDVYESKGLINKDELLVKDIIYINFYDYLNDFISNIEIIDTKLDITNDNDSNLIIDINDNNSELFALFLSKVSNFIIYDKYTSELSNDDEYDDDDFKKYQVCIFDLNKYSKNNEIPKFEINTSNVELIYKCDIEEISKYYKKLENIKFIENI